MDIINKTKRKYYAWFVCAGCALLLFCNAGLAMGGFGVYLPYIVDTGDFTNIQGSLLMTIRSLAAVCGTAVALKITNKLDLRANGCLAGFIGAASFLTYSIADSYFTYCAAVIMAGLSYGTGSILLAGMIISRWFNKSRALAMGIAVSGTGIAIAAAPAVVTALITAVGLRMTFRIEAIFIIAMILIATLLIKNRPENIGLQKYGSELNDSTQNQDTLAVKNASPFLSHKGQLLMVFAVFLLGVGEPSYSQLSMLLHTSSYDASTVSMILSFGGIMVIIGKLVYGRATDTLGSFKANCIVLSAMIIGQALFALANTQSNILMFIAMAFFGLSISLHTVGLTTLATDTSNSREFPVRLKTYQTVYMCGSLVYSIVPGVIADITGSYIPSYILTTIFTTICTLIIIKIYNVMEHRTSKSSLTPAYKIKCKKSVLSHQ